MAQLKQDFSSAAETAYRVIRDRILDGEFAPGDKLSRRGMAKLTGFSVIPVIDALHRLEEDGIVESMPQWGSRVVMLTDEKIRDVFALREAIECQVARMLVATLNPQQESALYAIAAELDTNLYRPDNDAQLNKQMASRHHDFHFALARCTGCPSLEITLQRINLFRLLQDAVSRNRPRTDLPSDWHASLISAIKSGCADTAEAAMRDHVCSSRAAASARPASALA